MFSAMLSGATEGSVTMDNSLIKMYKEQMIDAKTALEASHDLEYMKRSIR